MSILLLVNVIVELGRFGSFAKLWKCVGLWGFANVPNVGWQRNFKKCKAGEIELFSFKVECVLMHSPVIFSVQLLHTFVISVSLLFNVQSVFFCMTHNICISTYC
jgi:hypothetical protein